MPQQGLPDLLDLLQARYHHLYNVSSYFAQCRTLRLADIWGAHDSFRTDVATQTQRLTLDVVGLVAFSHDFGQTERIRRYPLFPHDLLSLKSLLFLSFYW
jgi:hypothetical protein